MTDKKRKIEIRRKPRRNADGSVMTADQERVRSYDRGLKPFLRDAYERGFEFDQAYEFAKQSFVDFQETTQAAVPRYQPTRIFGLEDVVRAQAKSHWDRWNRS